MNSTAAAAVAGFGGPGPRLFELLRWIPRPDPAGTIIGYADVETSAGLLSAIFNS